MQITSPSSNQRRFHYKKINLPYLQKNQSMHQTGTPRSSSSPQCHANFKPTTSPKRVDNNHKHASLVQLPPIHETIRYMAYPYKQRQGVPKHRTCPLVVDIPINLKDGHVNQNKERKRQRGARAPSIKLSTCPPNHCLSLDRSPTIEGQRGPSQH